MNNLKYKYESLSSIVVDHLRHKILTGEYKEGDHILEAEVAAELGISRAPVREGIKELQDRGLIIFIPRKGNYVAKFDHEDIKEIFDIRILLENYVFEKIIDENRMSQDDFDQLTSIVDEMVEIAQEAGNDTEKILHMNKKDIEFHTFLWNKSGSTRTVKILSDLYFQLQMAMVIDTKLTGDLDPFGTDHYEIIKYLKAKDLSQCLTALKNSIVTYKLYDSDKIPNI